MGMNARFSFTEQELKCLLYAVSKIRPHDSLDQEYTYDFQSFYLFFPGQKDPQSALIATLLSLDRTNWWSEITPGIQRSVRFFTEIKINYHLQCVSLQFALSMHLVPASK